MFYFILSCFGGTLLIEQKTGFIFYFAFLLIYLLVSKTNWFHIV